MTKLRSFQWEGVCMIREFRGRALLADEMGLGKTLQSLKWISKIPNRRPVVIVCPASLKYTWQAEAALHLGMRAEVLEGNHNGHKSLPGDIIVLNYDILGSWLKLLLKFRPQVVILDEVHFIKSLRAKRTKHALKLCENAASVIGISGTPLTNRPVELWPILRAIRPDLYPSFEKYAWKFCLPKDAPILMSDLTEKHISDVGKGDKVIGWKRVGKQRRLVVSRVLGTMTKKAPLQKVYLDDGTSFISTPDHLWSTGNSHYGRQPQYNYARKGRGIMKVLRAPVPFCPENEDYQLGYIEGIMRGDGHCSETRHEIYHAFKQKVVKRCQKYQIGCAMKDKEPLIRLKKYLTNFSIKTKLKKRGDGLFSVVIPKSKKNFHFFCGTQRNTQSWWAGFLGGIYDAEGSGCRIHQSIKYNLVSYSMIETALTRFGFLFKKDKIKYRYLGGKKEICRFWSIANPALRRKLISALLSEGGATGGGVGEKIKPKVIKILPLEGEHKTYTLTTETGNYVAYGLGSKNCKPRYTHWGWVFDGATNLKELNRTLRDECMIRRLKKDVLTELPAKQMKIVSFRLKSYKEYNQAQHDFLNWLRKVSPAKAKRAKKAQALAKIGYLIRLAARLKLEWTEKWIEDFFESHQGEKLVCFTMHTFIIDRLKEKFKNRCVVIDGNVKARMREESVRQFRNNPKRDLFLGNWKAAGVGITLVSASNVVSLDLPWTPGDLAQGGDRVHRIGQKKKVTFHHLIALDTIEEKQMSILHRKSKILDAVLDGRRSSRDVDIFSELLKELKGKK